MSCSKWRYTEACDGRPCPGDCDECSFDPGEVNYTATLDDSRIQYQPMNWDGYMISNGAREIPVETVLQIAWETIPEEYYKAFEERIKGSVKWHS